MNQENKPLFLYFSEKANNQVGHIVLTLKNGKKIKYTALYNSQEEAEIYTYEDKQFLGEFLASDIINQERIQGQMYLSLMNATPTEAQEEIVKENNAVIISENQKKIKFKVKK